MILDERGGALEAVAGTKREVLATLRERWPRLPVVEVPFVSENPAGIPRHVEVTYVGRGEYARFL